MKAEGPVVETETIFRPVSMARIRVIAICWSPSALPAKVALLVSTAMMPELSALSRKIRSLRIS